MDQVIKVQNLTMSYGDVLIQKDLNFSVRSDDIFIIMGGSGTGKSTLLGHLMGLIEPKVGVVEILGQSMYDLSAKQRQGLLRQFGVMFQGGALWADMTLGENVSLPLEEFTDLNKKEIKDLVDYNLALVGLEKYQSYKPGELSGGMRKRAAIARAIALDPKIVFLDEPSAGLDPISSKLLDRLICELSQTMKKTVVVVTHELDSILSIGTNSIFLDRETKTIIDSGEPKYLKMHSKHSSVRNFLGRIA